MLFVAIEANTNVSKQWIDPIFYPSDVATKRTVPGH